MYKVASAIISAFGLAQLAAAQGDPIPIPAVTAPGAQGAPDCGGCYVVADVAGVAFGTETLSAVQTDSVIVQPGLNGTYTTTSVIFDQGQFTFGSSGVVAAPAPTGNAGIAYNTDGTTVVLSGVTLTSPTAYNVFTAYSVTSRVFTNGQCQIVAGTSVNLANAFSFPIPAGANPANYALSAQQAFVSSVGLPSCSLGAIDYAATTHIPVDVSTTAVTTTQSARATPQMVSISTAATGPTATPTFVPGSAFNVSRTAYLPGGTGTYVVSYTGRVISAAGAARNSALGSFLGGVIAFVAGVVA